MEPDEILKLMHTASERYRTVRAALRYRGDGSTLRAIDERIPRSEAGRTAFRVPNREFTEPVEHSVPDAPFGWRSRVWHDDENRWRIEAELPDGGVEISASAGLRRRPKIWPFGSRKIFWNQRVEAGPRFEDPRWFWQALDHYWTFYPLRTDGIAGISYRFDDLPSLRIEGTIRWAGREAVRLIGAPSTVEQDHDPDPLSWGADEYEAVVDLERGILLRVASRLNGSDFEALEVEEVHFDEPFPAEVFASREPLSWP